MKTILEKYGFKSYDAYWVAKFRARQGNDRPPKEELRIGSEVKRKRKPKSGLSLDSELGE